MLRNNVLKTVGAARRYSTTPSPAPSALSIEEQLNSLLARVDALGKAQPQARFDRKDTKKSNNNNSNNKQFGKKQFNNQKSATPREDRPFLKSQQAPQTQQKSKISQSTNELGELFAASSDTFQPQFTQPKPKLQTQSQSQSAPRSRPQQSRFFPNQRAQSPNRAFDSNKSRPPQRKNNNKKRSNRDSTSITNKSLPFKNPNLDIIQTAYAPEQLSLTDLMLHSPLTSQTEPSRLIKAYQRLAIDSKADITGILTGNFDNELSSTSSSKVLTQLKTPALKLNGETVFNSLNSNGSIDYETKVKLLKPLTGLAPVRELNA